MPRPVPLTPAVALALALAGCPDNVDDPFPKSVGYQPLAYCPAATPAAWPTDPVDPCPEVVNIVLVANCGGQLSPDKNVVVDQAQARGYLKASLATAWSRIQPIQDGDPNWVRLCRNGGLDAWAVPGSRCVDTWHWLPGTESQDFPVSFRMKYHVDEIVSVDWEHTWRQGPLEGTVVSPLAVGARYQKTWGIENLRVQTTSYVLRPAPDESCTSIELVGWLDADQSNETSVAGTVHNAFNLLREGVHTP